MKKLALILPALLLNLGFSPASASEGAYSQLANTSPAGMSAQSFAQIEREGGLRDAIDIPITAVRYQKNGRVTVLKPDLVK